MRIGDEWRHLMTSWMLGSLDTLLTCLDALAFLCWKRFDMVDSTDLSVFFLQDSCDFVKLRKDIPTKLLNVNDFGTKM